MWGHVRVKKIEWVVKTSQIRNRSFLYNRAWLWFRRGHLKWISSWWLLIKKKRDPKIDWKGGCEIDYLTTLIRDKQQIELVPSMSFYFITAVTPPESGNAYDLFIIKPNPFARNIQTALNSSDVNALWVTSAQSTFAAILIYRNYSSFFVRKSSGSAGLIQATTSSQLTHGVHLIQTVPVTNQNSKN